MLRQVKSYSCSLSKRFKLIALMFWSSCPQKTLAAWEPKPLIRGKCLIYNYNCCHLVSLQKLMLWFRPNRQDCICMSAFCTNHHYSNHKCPNVPDYPGTRVDHYTQVFPSFANVFKCLNAATICLSPTKKTFRGHQPNPVRISLLNMPWI